ncbi:MAG: hypothetical protein WBO43_02450 [Gemmatimonadota bacterium]
MMHVNPIWLLSASLLLSAGPILAQAGTEPPGRTARTTSAPATPEDGGPRNWAGGGYATVVIDRPDGRTRAVYFRMGIPIGADTSEADWGDFSATREGDLNLIRVGEERYEIPDVAVLGD